MSTKVKKNNSAHSIELLYKELESVMKEKKFSKKDLVEAIPEYNTRQSFGEAFNRRTLKLLSFFSMAEAMGVQFVATFAEGDYEREIIVGESKADKYKSDITRSSVELLKANLAQKDEMIRTLQEQVKDKQSIIDLLKQEK